MQRLVIQELQQGGCARACTHALLIRPPAAMSQPNPPPPGHVVSPPLKTKSLNPKLLLFRSTATATRSSCPCLTTPTKRKHCTHSRFMMLRWEGWSAARNHRRTLSAFAFCFEPGSMPLCASLQPAPPPTPSPTLSRRAPRCSHPQ